MRSVIFDCDGVLVDSEPVANRVLAEGLTAIGLPTSTEDSVRDFMGRSWGHMVEVVTERLGTPPPATLRDDYRAALFAAYAAGDAPAVEGIAEALDGLDAAGTPTASPPAATTSGSAAASPPPA